MRLKGLSVDNNWFTGERSRVVCDDSHVVVKLNNFVGWASDQVIGVGLLEFIDGGGQGLKGLHGGNLVADKIRVLNVHVLTNAAWGALVSLVPCVLEDVFSVDEGVVENLRDSGEGGLPLLLDGCDSLESDICTALGTSGANSWLWVSETIEPVVHGGGEAAGHVGVGLEDDAVDLTRLGVEGEQQGRAGVIWHTRLDQAFCNGERGKASSGERFHV